MSGDSLDWTISSLPPQPSVKGGIPSAVAGPFSYPDQYSHSIGSASGVGIPQLEELYLLSHVIISI